MHDSAVHRAQLFRGFGRRVRVQDVVPVMNKAATQDLRVVQSWPVIRRAIVGWPAPDPLTQTAASMLTNWWHRGGSRLDRNGDGKVDDPGAAVMDTAWPLLAKAITRGGLHGDVDAAASVIGVGGSSSPSGSSFGSGWWGYVSKGLRRLEGRKVHGPLRLRYCGGGRPRACRAAISGRAPAGQGPARGRAGTRPDRGRAQATRIKFQPGLQPDTMRWTNRPAFQQALELTH